MIALVLIVIASAGLFAKTRDYGLMGWDTYPIIVSSRVQSPDDLAANFTEQLMAGRHPEGFYRPILNLSIALDYALWGLEPKGYHLSGVLLFAGCAVALYVLVGRMVGSGSLVAPLVALAFFLLHATHFEVLPVPSRRPELLCCLFMLVSLALQVSERALTSAVRPVLPAVFTLLAFASKETAFVLPIIVFAGVWLYSTRPTLRGRLLHSLKALIPHAVALGAVLAIRVAILGGIGGARSSGFAQAFTTLMRAFGRMFEYLLVAQPAMKGSAIGRSILIVLATGLVVTGLLVRRSQGRQHVRHTTGSSLMRPGLIALVWLVVVGLSYAVAGRIRPWYMPVPVAGFAILLGALAGWLVDVIRRWQTSARILAVPTFLTLIGFVIWQGSYSPVLRPYDEWQRATAVSHFFLKNLESQIERASDGSVIVAPPIPIWAEPTKGDFQIRGAAILADYTIEAWAELTLPDRRVRVCQATDEDCDRVGPDEILVVLTERLAGY
jgi:hypothetical protein